MRDHTGRVRLRTPTSPSQGCRAFVILLPQRHERVRAQPRLMWPRFSFALFASAIPPPGWLPRGVSRPWSFRLMRLSSI